MTESPALLRFRQALVEQLAEPIRLRPAPLTRRRVFGPVRLPGKATAVIGMRRAGKTTFLHQIRQERIERGVPGECLPYLSFEDERLAGMESSHLGTLVDEYHRRFPGAGNSTVTWHFDEIQTVPGWERFVRRLLDTEGNDVVVTGSSAALLSREIATALRGRAWRVLIHPFSFEEALRHQGRPVPDGADAVLLTGRARSRLERHFLDWIEVGGFPEVQGVDATTRHRLLRDYVDVAMLRDVVERHDVRNVAGLRHLVRHLLGNAGASFSVGRFHGVLRSQGIAIGKDALHQFLAYLEDCFLVRTLWMETASERQRMVNPRKAYPVDPGLIPVFDRTGRANTGHALETAVLVELERRGYEVTYIRTPEGYEVDFFARGIGGECELIQVCADLSDAATAAREFRALSAAAALFPQAHQRLLTLTRDRLPPEAPAAVEVQTACEWLLGIRPPWNGGVRRHRRSGPSRRAPGRSGGAGRFGGAGGARAPGASGTTDAPRPLRRVGGRRG